MADDPNRFLDDPTLSLDHLDNFNAALEIKAAKLYSGEHPLLGRLYCPGCVGSSRVRAVLLCPPPVPKRSHMASARQAPPAPPKRGPQAHDVEPAEGDPGSPSYLKSVVRGPHTIVCDLTCVMCDTHFTAVRCPGPSGPVVVLLSSKPGGLSTPHSPEGVKYYLDQAQRAHSVGANSAAIAMYRAALEQLLLDQGCTRRMLGPKLEELEERVRDGTAPEWAAHLDRRYLDVIRRLGNNAIHAGDGDVTRLDALDSALLGNVQVTVSELLNRVYEAPHRDAARLASLTEAADETR